MQAHPVPARAVAFKPDPRDIARLTEPLVGVLPLFRTDVASVSPFAPGNAASWLGDTLVAKSIAVPMLTVVEPVNPLERVSATEIVWLPSVLRVN